MAEEQLENWESKVRGKIEIFRLAPDGSRRPELVYGGREFWILPSDRKANESRIPRRENNPFRNGSLRLKNADANVADDTDALRETSAVLDDKDLTDMLKLGAAQLAKRLAEINDLPVLERIKALADESDLNPTRMKAVDERLAAARGPVAQPLPPPAGDPDGPLQFDGARPPAQVQAANAGRAR